jgi:intracellular multiplication protein IcmB
VCGSTASERAIQELGEKFSLSETARWVVRYRLTGPKPSGSPVLLILSTTEGRYEQHLVNTLGPIELWALSTSAEDVVIRTKLYEKVGAVKARRLLATLFPGGTARHEIRRRVVIRTERGELTTNAQQAVMQEMVDELAAYVTREVLDGVLEVEKRAAAEKAKEAEANKNKATKKRDFSGSSSRASGTPR